MSFLIGSGVGKKGTIMLMMPNTNKKEISSLLNLRSFALCTQGRKGSSHVSVRAITLTFLCRCAVDRKGYV